MLTRSRARRAGIATAALLGLLVSVASCSDAPRALRPPVRASTLAPGDTRSFFKVTMHSETTGAEEFTLDTETVLDVHEISGGTNPVAIWFLTVSVGETLVAPDGSFVTYSADLAPGSYRGPGTYTIDGGGQSTVLGVKTNLGSAAYLALVSTTNPGPPARYDVLVKPCTLVYTRHARTGSISCPELGNAETRKAITWSMRWERL